MKNIDMPDRYNPGETEDKWYRFWIKSGIFHAEPGKGGRAYTIVIPPPNITGILHMGHALNNTIQDILIRWKRMQGYNTLWLPGTDHAGIATQNVVERSLAAEGKTREELGRERFIEKVWEWRKEYGGTIINQLKRMGCSCDWARTRFTMDEGLSSAVKEVFVRLYNKGLIYRGNYIINWCPRCRTALSDEESEHKETEGVLYYIKYPVKGGDGYITVATTRPETMLGDTAVAVNPYDKRYKKLHRKAVILPVINRELRVIEDDYVDPEFGTGIVKITPAHDPNDFLIGIRHKLDAVNVMNEDATMNGNAGRYSGMDRFACRKKLLEDLRSAGLLEKTEKHSLAVGHCYRCGTIVEPRISRQWFVRMKPLAQRAKEAVEKEEIRFVPERWSKVYLEWMNNIRDWCISRQIWWGHRIPVWYCESAREGGEKCKEPIVSKTAPAKCPHCGGKDLRQDEDVLDTWFSSWLWPFSTMGWPENTGDLKFYYPTCTLVTAQEIIFFWVARMIMAGFEFMGKMPFHTVYIHGTVRDETGTKMSKSLGNVIDPLEIIEEFGADALRFSLISITSQGQDVFLSRHRFETGRNFTNKIWNAARFILMNAGENEYRLPPKEKWSLDDWFIMSRLQKAVQKAGYALETFRFKDAAHTIYDFFWGDLCDKYIEAVKPYLYGTDESCRRGKYGILCFALETTLRLLHPFMPYITEEIWHRLKRNFNGSVSAAGWPVFNEEYCNENLAKYADAKFEFINKGRSLRSEYNVEPKNKLDFYIKTDNERILEEDSASICRMLGADSLIISRDFTPFSPMPSAPAAGGIIYMSLKGTDTAKENERLEKEILEAGKQLEITEKRLSNEQFRRKAPEDVVKKTIERKKILRKKIDKLISMKNMLEKF